MKKRIWILLMVAFCFVTFLNPGNLESVKAAAKPEVVIINYVVADDFVLGEETVISVTFMNMNTELNCSSVLVSYTSANQSVVPAIGHSNQLFLGDLGAGQKETVQIPVVIYDRGDGYATMTLNIEYSVGTVSEIIAGNITESIIKLIPEEVPENLPQSITRELTDYVSENLTEKLTDKLFEFSINEIPLYGATSYIVFPIGDDSIYIRNVNVTTETTVGANSLVSVSFDNNLKTELTNAKLIISGDVENGQISYQIGNVSAKATKYAEHYLKFTSVGQKNIKLQLVYTSDKGEEITKDIGEYSISVKAGTSQIGGDISLDGEENQKETGNTLNLAVIFLDLAELFFWRRLLYLSLHG